MIVSQSIKKYTRLPAGKLTNTRFFLPGFALLFAAEAVADEAAAVGFFSVLAVAPIEKVPELESGSYHNVDEHRRPAFCQLLRATYRYVWMCS